MNKTVSFLIFILFVNYSFSQIDRTKTYTQQVKLNPGAKNGFIGTVTMVYAFGNCYGDAVLVYGYKNLNITKVKYKSKTYTLRNLEIADFAKYKTAFTSVQAEFFFSFNNVGTKSLSYLLDDYDLGCFGQTYTIASKNAKYNKDLNSFSVRFKDAVIGMSLLLSSKIDSFEKKKQDNKTYNKLLFKVGSTKDIQEKINILKKAKRFAHTAKEKVLVDISIKNYQETLEKKRKEALRKKEKEKKGKNPHAINPLVLTSKSTKVTPKIAAVKSTKKTGSYSKSSNTSSYNVNEIMSRNNTLYRQDFSKLNAAADQLSSLIGSMMDRKRKQRQARERQQQLREQRIEDEKEKKRYFYKKADRYVKETEDYINQRKAYFINKQYKPTYSLDGSSFEPIYIVYAYTKKGYEMYYKNIRYPSTLDIKPKIEKAVVRFSPVMAVFPFSNGTYPYYEDIKRNILENHVPFDKSKYDIRFLDAETSVKKIVTSLTKNMKNAVNYHNFSSATPSKNNSILFINDKIVSSNSKDYWTNGAPVQKGIKKEINYFKANDSTKTKKLNYFKTETSQSKNKLNYWGSTKKKTDTSKSKNIWIIKNN